MFKKHRIQFTIFVCILMVFSIFSACGCGSTMALRKDMSTLSITKESIALLTLKISNQFTPKYQRRVANIVVWPIEDETVVKLSKVDEPYNYEDEIVVELFKAGEPYNYVEEQYYEYLISFQLPPGKYRIKLVEGYGRCFYFHIDADFELKPNSIVYIGHIEMINRKRKEGEPRSLPLFHSVMAGGVIPAVQKAIEQSRTRFTESTFDVEIYDKYDRDLTLFKQSYPVISNYEVEKMILRKKASAK